MTALVSRDGKDVGPLRHPYVGLGYRKRDDLPMAVLGAFDSTGEVPNVLEM